RIMRAPLCFFDTTPTGVILNRFSKDIDAADNAIRMHFRLVTFQFFRACMALVIIANESILFLPVAFAAGVFYFVTLQYYIQTARQLKRLTSVLRSPCFNHFCETAAGATSIRAYDAINRFTQKFYEIMDSFTAGFFLNSVVSRWLSVRLEVMADCI